MAILKKANRLLNKGIATARGKHKFPPDFTADEIEIIRQVSPYTKTSRERLVAMIRATRYVEDNQIEGAIVECGVYKGGSMLAAAQTLLDSDQRDRDLFLYDTFEGMKQPCERDINIKGIIATRERAKRDQWSRCPLEAVQQVFHNSGYPADRLHFVKGMVEDTIPGCVPEKIAILRLDTDWYESTKHELEHLFPRLVSGGVMIIDDYGHWKGAREATDEYFREVKLPIFLNRIDYTGRLVVKP